MIEEAIIFGNAILSKEANLQELDETKACIRIFKNAFPHNIFKDEFYVIYEALSESFKYGGFLKEEHFKSILVNSIDALVLNKSVDLSKYDSFDSEGAKDIDEKKQSFAEDCLYAFIGCQSQRVSIDQYKLGIGVYIDNYKKEKMSEIIINTYKINNDGVKEKGQVLIGTDSATMYYQREISKLDSLLSNNDSSVAPIKVDPDGYYEYKDERVLEPLAKFGIEEIDQVLGNLYRTEVISILGESGKGKTRNAINVAYNALLMGSNVVWYALEGSPEEVEAMFVARHIAQTKGINPICDRDIIRRSEIFFKYQKTIELARKDFYFNPDMGKVFITLPTEFLVENIGGYLETIHDEWRPFDLVVVDYMSLAQSKKYSSTTEMVAHGVKSMKNIGTTFKGKGLLVLLPHQLTKDAVDALRSGKDPGTYVSSDSSEVVKTSDFSIAIYSNADMELKNQLEYITIKKRKVQPIPKFTAFSALGNCLFATSAL